MSEVTATQILSHCKAVVNWEIKDNCVDIYDSEAGYNLYPRWVHLFVSEASSPSDLMLAARILGLYRPAPVVLEWVEEPWIQDDVAKGKIHRAKFNEFLSAKIQEYPQGICHGVLEINGMGFKYGPHVNLERLNASEMKAWCERKITEITTPTPTPRT